MGEEEAGGVLEARGGRSFTEVAAVLLFSQDTEVLVDFDKSSSGTDGVGVRDKSLI